MTDSRELFSSAVVAEALKPDQRDEKIKTLSKILHRTALRVAVLESEARDSSRERERLIVRLYEAEQTTEDLRWRLLQIRLKEPAAASQEPEPEPEPTMRSLGDTLRVRLLSELESLYCTTPDFDSSSPCPAGNHPVAAAMERLHARVAELEALIDELADAHGFVWR